MNYFIAAYMILGGSVGQLDVLSFSSNRCSCLHFHPNVNVGVFAPSNLYNGQFRANALIISFEPGNVIFQVALNFPANPTR